MSRQGKSTPEWGHPFILPDHTSLGHVFINAGDFGQAIAPNKNMC